METISLHYALLHIVCRGFQFPYKSATENIFCFVSHAFVIKFVMNFFRGWFQERRAFLFCREDRAILCRECDIAIHRANEQTKRHTRYLLTGVKLSSSSCSSVYTSSSSSSSCSEANTNNNNNISENFSSQKSIELNDCLVNDNKNLNPMSTSNISEYFDTLPSWRVDDFLDPSEAYWKVGIYIRIVF